MPNPFFTYGGSIQPFQRAKSISVAGELLAVQAGFDGVQAYSSELVAARQGQLSLLANLGRYVTTANPVSGDVDFGGFLVRNVSSPLLSGDAANKSYVDGMTLTNITPTVAGNSGKELTNNGSVAAWGLSVAGAISLMNSGCI